MIGLEAQAIASFANACDLGRLYELEWAGKLPCGYGDQAMRRGLAYLIRIVQLQQKFRDGGYPGFIDYTDGTYPYRAG